MGGELYQRVKKMTGFAEPVKLYPSFESLEVISQSLQKILAETGAQIGLGASYQPGTQQQDLTLFMITPHGKFETVRSYGGPPQMGMAFAVNTAIDFLRRNLTSSENKG